MVTLWVTFLGELELQPVSLLFSLSMNLLSHFCGGHHRFVEARQILLMVCLKKTENYWILKLFLSWKIA